MILMHKDVPAAKVSLISGQPKLIKEIYNKNELPVGIYNSNPALQTVLLDSWVKSRTIPNGRPGTDKIFEKIGISSGEAFLNTSAISLTDTFWLKEEDNPLTWADVNFYDNGFEPIFSKCYLSDNHIPFAPSPDFTTDGVLEKFWITSYGVPYLIKMDTKFNGLQVANEVVASRIANYLKIPHVLYLHIKVGDIHGCICKSFINDSTQDFVNLLQLKHANMGSAVDPEELIPQAAAENIKNLDVLLGNVDRHEKNIGIINGNLSPIFDSGSCLNFDDTGNNPELKFPRLYRSQVTTSFNKPLEFETLSCIIQEVYKEFEIDTVSTKRALESLEYGCQLLNNKQNIEENLDDRDR